MEELEKKLKRLMAKCAKTTGLESYQHNDECRRQVLIELEKHRVLTRWEYICCYGYQAWRAYTEKHKIPEAYPFASK